MLRRLLLVTLSVVLICQFGWTQTLTPTQLGSLVNATGKAMPVVPPGTVARGYARPFIWMGEMFGGKGLISPNLPNFCNVVNNRGGFNFCPNAMQVTYGINSISYGNGGQGMTIAIVDAFHYKNAEADLTFFNNEMGLPACTRANGCFSNYDQNGNDAQFTNCGSNLNWELETMLDIEWAHAMAPNAKIMLVEGCTNSFDDLIAAVNTAVAKGADVVSNSYGAGEFVGESALDPAYFQPVPIIFSSGDDGAAGKQYPCASQYTTCIGGTRLMPDLVTFVRVSETGWTAGGGGCALVEEPIPSWQSLNGVNACSTRNMPDIAADADPDTGAVVYDSGNGGHFRVGGTSLSAPVMAGIFADLDTARTTAGPIFLRKPKLAGAVSPNFVNKGLYLKYAGHNLGNPYVFYYYDVVAGNNGYPALPGYDLVTGLGVLNGPHAGPPWNLP